MSYKTQPPQPSLQTERLLLRPFVMSDAPAIRSIVDNEEVASTMRSMVLPYTEAMAKQWIQPQADIWNSGAAAVFAVCWNPQETATDSRGAMAPGDASSGGVSDSGPLLIGAVGLEICKEDEKGEMGFWVDQSCWGKGVATEAAGALVKFGFEKLCLHKIVSFHMVRNPASGRVMEKIGMRKEGLLRDHVKKLGKFEDSVAYGIVAGDV